MLFSELTVDMSISSLPCSVHVCHGPSMHAWLFFLNIQMEGSTNNNLWQHWLYLVCNIGGWEDVFVSCLHPIISSPPF